MTKSNKKQSLARVVESCSHGNCLIYTIKHPRIAFRVGSDGLLEIDDVRIIGVDICEL